MAKANLQEMPPEHGVIVRCLVQVRRRLWAMRVLERAVLGLAWGAGLGIVFTGARLLCHRWPFWAALLSLVPIGAAVWLWMQADKPQGSTAAVTPLSLRVTAVLSAAACLAMMVLIVTGIAAASPVWGAAAGSMALFVLAGVSGVRMIDNRTAAIFVDQHAGLREKVSTALEMLEVAPSSPMERAFQAPVVVCALDACRQVRLAKAAYQRLDNRAYALAALVAISAAALTLFPPVPARAVSARKTIVPTYNQSRDLQQVLKDADERRLPNDKVTAERLKPIEAAVERLQQGNLSPIEAQAVLSEPREQLKRDQAAVDASNRVEEMLRNMRPMEDFARATQTLTEANMQEARGEAGANARQAGAQRALQEAADAMAQTMAGDQMSESQRKDLAAGLNAAADRAGADSKLQSALRSAADAASRNDAGAFAQHMADAGQRMGQQRANGQMSQESVDRAMAEIDRMQGGGSQSTMGSPGGGNQGQSGGDQGGDQNGEQGGMAGGSQSQDGQGGQDGQGSQQAAQAGAGSATGRGGGSTMMDNPSGPGDQYEGTQIGGRGSFVRVYEPRITQTGGSQEKIGSHINPLAGPAAGTADIMGPADDGESTLVPLRDQLPSLRQRGMDDLNRQVIPPQYEEMVRRFYEQ